MEWQMLKIFLFCLLRSTAAARIHDEARNGNLDAVVALVEEGAEVNTPDRAILGRTPLMYAAREGHSEVMKYLIMNGANVDQQNKIEMTPLMYAAREGHSEVVKYLILKGATVDQQDNDVGWTPLMLAAFNGHYETVKFLLDKGANVDQQDNYGWTPLMYAAWGGHYEIVKFLLDKGANIDQQDNDGNTALWFAISFRQFDIACYLVGKGANTNAANFGRIEGKCFWKGNSYDVGSEWNDGEDLLTCQDTCSVVTLTTEAPTTEAPTTTEDTPNEGQLTTEVIGLFIMLLLAVLVV